MATQNAIDTTVPIGVSVGGTGASTLTDNGVLVGSGTAAVTPIAVGSTGELLVGASTADPAFGTSATGDFTFTSSTASQTRVLTVSNTDNTGAATSAARLDVEVGGTNVGDPQISYAVTGATTWSTGIDNSDDDKFKISANVALGTTNVLTATTDGEVTKPLQPAFLATLSAIQSNVTGNGALYDYVCNTEVFDQGSNHNTSTGIFTAPVTGKYVFNVSGYLSGAATAFGIQVFAITSNRNYRGGFGRPADSSDMFAQCTAIVDMDASDTAFPRVRAFGETGDTLDLEPISGTDTRTYFSGYLAC